MNRILIIIITVLGVFHLQAQQQVSLEHCYEKAIENYPLTLQGELLNSSNALTQKSLNKNYLPELYLNGQVHYQSDVTKTPSMEIPVFEIEPLSKDQYRIMLDVNQVIYDGSTTSRQKQLELVNHEISKQNLEVELYNLKQRINQVFFQIILLKENEKILELHKATLLSQFKTVQSGVKNGTMLSSNEDIIMAEIIQVEQSIEEVSITRNAFIAILHEYTDLDLFEDTEFLIPEIQVELNSYTNNRPEYELFSMEKLRVEASKKLVEAKNLPRLSAFGQAGYGRPGYDMLKNEFDDFYMVGARLSWNFWDWNQNRKEKEILDVQNDIIHTRMQTFDKNIRIDLQNKLATIRKSEKLILRDEEIIKLRVRITKSSSSQLANGTITSTEYITELNAESKARLDLEVHKIQLVNAKLEYQTTLGNI